MEKKNNTFQAIDLLIGHEELVGSLYGVYAEKFPDLTDFWKKIASDERGHAGMLKGLRTRIAGGVVAFNRDKFPAQAIILSIEYVEKLIGAAKNTDVPLLGALNTALDIEDGFIEKEYYKVVEGDSEEISELFTRIAGEERRHRDEIKGRLAQLSQ